MRHYELPTFRHYKDQEAGQGSFNTSYITFRVVKPKSGGWVLMTEKRAAAIADALNAVLDNAQAGNAFDLALAETLHTVLSGQLWANGVEREDEATT